MADNPYTEAAERIVRRWRETTKLLGPAGLNPVDALAYALRDAVEAEREACAKAAENFGAFTGAYGGEHEYGRGGRYVREGIASAIRSRTTE